MTARTTLGNLRMRYDFPTRRKSQRSKYIEIGTIDAAGRQGRAKVPVAEYPVGAFIPSFERAGCIVGFPESVNRIENIIKNYPTDDINAFREKYNWDGRVTPKYMPVKLAQIIVKMCYAYAIGELGFYFESMCVPYVLGDKRNISHIFGQFGGNSIKSGEQSVWNITFPFIKTADRGALLMAYCSIMQGMGTPIYEVVLGSIHSDEHIALFKDKLTNNGFVQEARPII